MKAILHTKGLIDEKNPEPEEKEIWGKVYDMMDGETAEVLPATAIEGKYVFLGLHDPEKDKELFYQMEQDPTTGVYIDDRKRFDEDWVAKEYEPEGCFYLETKNVEIIPDEDIMTSFVDDYKELRTLITENPTLPLIFMAGDGCTNPDYAWTVASARAKKGIYLTSMGPNEEKMYSSEDDLQEDIDDKISEQHGDWTDEEVLEATAEELKKYEDKWVDVIYLYIEAY